MPSRIWTRDLWLWYHVELYTPTNPIQNFKVMGRGGQFTYMQHSPLRGGSLRHQMWNRREQQLFYLIALIRIQTRDLWLWYHIELHAPTSSTQKLKLMGRGGQFTYIPTPRTRNHKLNSINSWCSTNIYTNTNPMLVSCHSPQKTSILKLWHFSYSTNITNWNSTNSGRRQTWWRS